MNVHIQIISSFAAAWAFSLLLHQPKNTIWASSVIGMIGYAMFLLLKQSTLGFFSAALVIGMMSELFARTMRCVSTTLLTPAIIPLVPGDGLYRTMRFLVSGNIEKAAAVGTASFFGFSAIALAISITTTFFFAIQTRQKHNYYE